MILASVWEGVHGHEKQCERVGVYVFLRERERATKRELKKKKKKEDNNGEKGEKER